MPFSTLPTPIWYDASTNFYGDDWGHFPSDETFVKSFPLTAHPFSVSDLDYCHNLIQLLTWETSQWTGTSRLCRHASTEDVVDYIDENMGISQLLRILFLKLRDEVLHHAASVHVHKLLMLRRQISNNPQLPWPICEMTEQLQLAKDICNCSINNTLEFPV